MATQSAPRSMNWNHIGRATLIAVLGSAVVNVILFFVLAGIDLIPDDVLVGPPQEPITVAPVIMASVMGALGGAVVYTLLAFFTANPRRLFLIIGLVVLVLSFGMPFGIEDAPAKMILALNLLHVTTAAITIWAFIGYQSESSAV